MSQVVDPQRSYAAGKVREPRIALAVNRTDVIFKKCDISNHRPETVKQCAAGTCQHTCKPDTIEKCTHAWTLRYWVNGKQLEKSFKDQTCDEFWSTRCDFR